MNLQPVSPNTGHERHTLRCLRCRLYFPIPEMLADLDGPAFIAYYCRPCAPLALAEFETAVAGPFTLEPAPESYGRPDRDVSQGSRRLGPAPIVTRTIGGVELTPEMCGSVESSEDEPGYYGTDNDSEIGPEIYPAPGAEPWYRNDRGMRDPQQAVKVHQETAQAYVRSLRNIGKAGACAILLSLLSLPAFAAPPCKVNVNTATPAELQLLARTGPVLALRLASGRPYRHLEAVDAVKGVGPSWLAVNGPHVAFSGPTTCTEKVAAPKVPKVAAQAPKP